MSLSLALQRTSSRVLERLPALCAAVPAVRAAVASRAYSSEAESVASSSRAPLAPSSLSLSRAMDGLGARVGTIEIPNPTGCAKNFEGELPAAQSVGSYNWLADRPEPTIAVPGFPQEWIANQKSEDPHPMPNPAHEPLRASFVPAFAAADALDVTIDWPALDVVADFELLHMLLRWIHSGRYTRQWERRIDVDVAGNTALLTQHRDHGQALLSRHGPPYQHLVTIDYFGLKTLVRFQAKDIASLNKQERTRDASAFAAPATCEIAGLKIADVGAKTGLSGLMHVMQLRRTSRTEAIPRRIVDLYPTALPTLVTVLDGKMVRDLNGEEPRRTRRANAHLYDRLVSVLAEVRRLGVERGPGRAMGLVAVGDKLNLYDRTAGPVHPAAVLERFQKT